MVLLMATEHYGDPQLGARLRALRLARGLTQKDLARPRYTHAYISTIEAGRRVPSQTALDFLAQKLGVDTEELELGRPKGSAERLRLQLEEARGDISSGNLDRALRTSNDVIRKAKEFRLGRVEARGYEIQALVLEQDGNLPAALRCYERASEGLQTEAPTARANAVAGEVRCLNALGDPHHAVFVGENYLERLKREQMAAPSSVLRVMSSLVLAYLAAGSMTKAQESVGKCQRLIPKVNDPSTLATAYVNVASIQITRAHYADADISLAKAEELFEAIDLQNEAGLALLARGYSLSRSGDLEKARNVLERASTALTRSRNTAEQANAQMELARLDRLEGNNQTAVDRLEKSLDQLGKRVQPRLEAWAHREIGLALTDIDPSRSQQHFKRALKLYEGQNIHVEVARTHMLIAEHRGHAYPQEQLLAYSLAAEAIERVPDI